MWQRDEERLTGSIDLVAQSFDLVLETRLLVVELLQLLLRLLQLPDYQRQGMNTLTRTIPSMGAVIKFSKLQKQCAQ